MPDGRRVLLIDDESSILAVLATLFDDEGYTVCSATNGQEALELLRGWRPDLILLDLMMPRMDGATFRAEQRRLDAAADVPLILLSAAGKAQTSREQFGAAAVIMKPFELEAVLDVVDQVLRTRA